MDVKYFELRAANKQCVEKFTDIAKQKVDKVPIFDHACEYVNNSSSYKRNGRRLEIMDIRDYSIIVKLTSESKLEMASKSLAGFSRELLRIDQSMNPDADSRLFRYFSYNSSLFRNSEIDIREINQNDTLDMSDVDALKRCVDLFCDNMTTSKEEAKRRQEARKAIKNILLDYTNSLG